ncbi:MAG: hypothetical protein K6U74_00395 [Firmicutes bacterium]|nr:hypothetical protein [Bacillota bacterium]
MSLKEELVMWGFKLVVVIAGIYGAYKIFVEPAVQAVLNVINTGMSAAGL